MTTRTSTRTALALVLASATALAGLPASAGPDAGPRIDMRVLLVSADGTEPAAAAWLQTLEAEGVPYDLFVAAQEPELTPSRLSAGDTRAYYQAVVLASADLAYNDPVHGWVSALSASEWGVIDAFEAGFGIRRVAAYAYPTPAVGLDYPHWSGSLDGTVATLTPKGREVFPSLAGPVPIAGSWGYLSHALDPLFMPLVTAPSGEPLVGVHTRGDGREVLALTVDSAPWALHSRLLLHGVLSWATRGTYLGFSRDYFSVQVDDLFSFSSRWDPVANVPSDRQPIRMTAGDLIAARDWSRDRGFRLDFPYNAAASDDLVAAEGADPLTEAVLANAGDFGFINHTYTHDNLNGAAQAKIEEEIARNIAWAATHGIDLDPRELVTGAHSGLDNPHMPAALAATGIEWIASDNSASNQQYAIGPALTVPRYPSSVYYDAATRAEQLDEYNYRWHETCPFAWCLQAPATWDEMVDRESTLFLTHVLSNDPRTHFVHQANLAEDRILYPVLDAVFDKYFRYRIAGFAQPTLSESGTLIRRQREWSAASDGTTAFLRDGAVHLIAPTELDVPVTGTTAGDVYAGERSGWVSVRPGQTITLPALGPAATDLPPVAASAAAATGQGLSVEVELLATDADSPHLDFAIGAPPARGRLSAVSAPACAPGGQGSVCRAAVTYSPDPSFDGTDSFTFHASDGTGAAAATVTITVRPAPRIAFVSDRNGSDQLYTVTEDGSAVVQLTTSAVAPADPAWSPDRRWVAFSALVEAQREIFVVDSRGASVVRVTDRPRWDDTDPAWSPDGASLVFASRGAAGSRIMSCPAAGGGCTPLTRTTSAESDPAFSPDGSQIAFVRGGDLWSMASDGTAQRRVLAFTFLSLAEPEWSPDDRWLLFTAATRSFAILARVDLDGRNLARVATGAASESSPSFSPDGSRIVFSSGRAGGGDVRTSTPDGADRRQVTSLPATDHSPAW